MTENSPMYRQQHMPWTNGGRAVRTIAGSPIGIEQRASDIESLGEKMARAALTLELFADGTVGKGRSFEAIREQAQEVHDDLTVAAKRYLPSGEALAAYAKALRTVQDETDGRVAGAERTWEEVRAASIALDGAAYDQREWDRNEDREVEQAGERPSSAAEQTAFDTAVSDWEFYWGAYDAPAETWETAYETACSSLEKANADGVRDSFWDNAMPFVEAMLTVLMWVGVALLVVAFFVTGPLALLAGVLAAVAGVLSLLGEIAKLNAGRGDWGSVALAVVGIVPFGKLAKVMDFVQPGALGKLTTPFRIAADDFAQYGSKLDDFVKTKVDNLFDVFDDAGNIVSRTPHGLNSQNLMRMLYTPQFLASGNSWVGSVRGGWMALAGNPTNAIEAIGGSLDAYFAVTGTLADLSDAATRNY